ncbi:MAG: hypothetical protein LDL27_02110, partial [Desulfovibrio sp.]|nr:hypothetical protein [Desulfovibrio sp.]
RSGDLPLESRLHSVLCDGLAFVADHPGAYGLLQKVLRGRDIPMHAEMVRQLRTLSARFITHMVEAAQARGEAAADIPAQDAAFFFVSLAEGFLTDFYESRAAAGAREQAESRARVLARLMADGLAGNPKE